MPNARAPTRSSRASAVLAALALAACDPLPDELPSGPPPVGFGTDMVAAHNAVRADLSIVGGSPAPDPALPPVAWSADAAAVAQGWADRCVYQHNAGRGELGENIAATFPPGAWDATAIVLEGWAAEAPFYAYATDTCNLDPRVNAFGTCGHYTQVVWRDTTAIGCGTRICSGATWPFSGGNPGPWVLWVCNYAPPGNWVGERPY